MTRDLYGLSVECNKSQINDFIKLRSILEPVMRKYLMALSEKPRSSIDSNFVKVPGNNPYYLTFCMTGKKIILSIYDKNKKDVADSCDWNDIKNLGVSEMNRLCNIIENYIKNNIKFPSLNALDVAWKKELLRRKQLEMTNSQKPLKKNRDLSFNELIQTAISNKAPPSHKDNAARENVR